MAVVQVSALLVVLVLRLSTPVQAQATLLDRVGLDAWLFCIECDQGQLDSVVAIVQRHPDAVDTLSSDLLTGIAGRRRARLEAQLRVSYGRLRAHAGASGRTPTVAERVYVSRYLGNASVLSRVRAALALGRIGGASARGSLDAALDSVAAGRPGFTGHVGRVLRFARDSLWTP